LNITRKNRANNFYDWPTVGEPFYSGKKTDKEKIFCPGVMSDIRTKYRRLDTVR
jgi:hypothetical protein